MANAIRSQWEASGDLTVLEREQGGEHRESSPLDGLLRSWGMCLVHSETYLKEGRVFERLCLIDWDEAPTSPDPAATDQPADRARYLRSSA